MGDDHPVEINPTKALVLQSSALEARGLNIVAGLEGGLSANEIFQYDEFVKGIKFLKGHENKHAIYYLNLRSYFALVKITEVNDVLLMQPNKISDLTLENELYWESSYSIRFEYLWSTNSPPNPPEEWVLNPHEGNYFANMVRNSPHANFYSIYNLTHVKDGYAGGGFYGGGIGASEAWEIIFDQDRVHEFEHCIENLTENCGQENIFKRFHECGIDFKAWMTQLAWSTPFQRFL